ncbi:unnamed protein product [Vitrella brassicaformis CCMP3155]|uniref:Uncharacterized protein n=3 Tax=Vitrella brassicaformis TaxID=1169539 RepID=A0A0G4EUP2_VITBC|nr:unnamed protein product [Vitrella brassicaformis CCMP3155]|eukprot:CEM02304.1 unnamed protein product [Vitrella brassicaformis CCMP3155]
MASSSSSSSSEAPPRLSLESVPPEVWDIALTCCDIRSVVRLRVSSAFFLHAVEQSINAAAFHITHFVNSRECVLAVDVVLGACLAKPWHFLIDFLHRHKDLFGVWRKQLMDRHSYFEMSGALCLSFLRGASIHFCTVRPLSGFQSRLIGELQQEQQGRQSSSSSSSSATTSAAASSGAPSHPRNTKQGSPPRTLTRLEYFFSIHYSDYSEGEVTSAAPHRSVTAARQTAAVGSLRRAEEERASGKAATRDASSPPGAPAAAAAAVTSWPPLCTAERAIAFALPTTHQQQDQDHHQPQDQEGRDSESTKRLSFYRLESSQLLQDAMAPPHAIPFPRLLRDEIDGVYVLGDRRYLPLQEAFTAERLSDEYDGEDGFTDDEMDRIETTITHRTREHLAWEESNLPTSHLTTPPGKRDQPEVAVAAMPYAPKPPPPVPYRYLLVQLKSDCSHLACAASGSDKRAVVLQRLPMDHLATYRDKLPPYDHREGRMVARHLTGLWTASYGPHGYEFLWLDGDGPVVCARKVTGDPNVPASTYTFFAELNAPVPTDDFSIHLQMSADPSRRQELAGATFRHYLGKGRLAQTNYGSPRWSPLHLATMNNSVDELFVLWHELTNLMGLTRTHMSDFQRVIDAYGALINNPPPGPPTDEQPFPPPPPPPPPAPAPADGHDDNNGGSGMEPSSPPPSGQSQGSGGRGGLLSLVFGRRGPGGAGGQPSGLRYDTNTAEEALRMWQNRLRRTFSQRIRRLASEEATRGAIRPLFVAPLLPRPPVDSLRDPAISWARLLAIIRSHDHVFSRHLLETGMHVMDIVQLPPTADTPNETTEEHEAPASDDAHGTGEMDHEGDEHEGGDGEGGGEEQGQPQAAGTAPDGV